MADIRLWIEYRMGNSNKPIIYIYIYEKIKKKAKGDIIRTEELKQILFQHIICKVDRGGNKKGLPKVYLYDVINEIHYYIIVLNSPDR